MTKRAKSILFVHPSNDFTGSTRVLRNVIKDSPTGFQKVVLTENHKLGFLSDIEGIRIYNIKFPQYKGKTIPFVSSALSLIDRVIKMTYLCLYSDMVYINTIRPYYAAILARLMGKKIKWHIHEKYISRPFSVKVMEFVLSHIRAHYIFVSYYLKNQYRIHKNATFEIRYNKLDSLFLSKINFTPLEKRPKNRVAMICSYTEAKGIDTFVQVSKLLPQYVFTLVMSTSQKNVEDFIKKTQVPRNCIILPAQKNINTIYENNDLVLVLSKPSLWVETFGMTIIEAFAYGLPVIGPNVGGPIEIIKNRSNGLTIDVSNIHLVKDSICEILQNKNYDDYARQALMSSRLYV